MVDAIVSIEPIKVLAGIIQTEMGLAAGKVMVYNQRYKPPTTKGVYIVLSYISGKAIGNNAGNTEVAGEYIEVQEVPMHEVIQIDVMSDTEADGTCEARARKVEVIMALGSQYAQRQCAEHLMQISRIPTEFVDISAVEGSSLLARYMATVNIKALYRKTKTAEYYDHNFTPEVHTDPKT